MKKPYSDLTQDDIAAHPIWAFLPETDEWDETWVTPVSSLPVTDLSGRVVGTTLHLVSGQTVPAVLGNVSLQSIRQTQHFLSVTVFRSDGQVFDLARYHDVDADRRGPSALADFLGLREADVFPMSYDISAVATGLPEVVSGQIHQEPKERLSEDQLIDMAIG